MPLHSNPAIFDWPQSAIRNELIAMAPSSNRVDAVRGLDHVVRDQQLGQDERVTDARFAIDVREFSDVVVSQMRSFREHLPEKILEALGGFIRDASRDPEHIDRFAISIPAEFETESVTGSGFDQRTEIGMGKRRSQQMMHIEMRARFGIVVLWWTEIDHDVRECPLRLDEALAVLSSTFQFILGFSGRITTVVAVTPEFPFDPKLLVGLHENLHVVAIAHRAGVKPEQALDDDVGPRRQIPGGLEGTEL